MDDLFRRADKYVMLEYDVQATSQQVLVMNRPTKNNKAGNSKPSNNESKQGGWKQDERQQQPLRLTPLTISCEQLILLIQELPKFKWPKPIKTDSTRQDWKQRCSYHKEHGHTTD